MHSATRILISVLVGAALAAFIAYAQISRETAAQPQNLMGSTFGGTFEGLTDENGKTVTATDFAGKYQLVFFGFTYCPSICPTELHKISKVLSALDAAGQAAIAPLFVSVDPERDTPKVLKEYTNLFSPAIVGLTGTPEAINKVKADWKVYAAKAKTGKGDDYTVNHSVFIYWRGPDGRLLDLFDSTQTPAAIAEKVKASLIQTRGK
ncbi:MAG: SCO family protein [Alphaproteobacteria bacterium]|nr:SCO family protein [Alphaproteobacteria bacterium]